MVLMQAEVVPVLNTMELFPKNLLAVLVVLVIIGAVVFFGVVPREAARRNNPVLVPPPYTVSAAASALHQSLFVADLHADSLLWDRDLLEHDTIGLVDIPRLIQGNVGLQVFSADRPMVGTDPAPFEKGQGEMGTLEWIGIEMPFLLLEVLAVRSCAKGLRTEADSAVSSDYRRCS